MTSRTTPRTTMRLLIIHHQLDFAVTVKRSLEQIGGYEVAPFTSADTALEYLQQRPHHIALVDFALRNAAGLSVIERLRAIQPDIAVIVTPKNTETLAAVGDYTLQDVIDTPIPIRQLLPILEGAMKSAGEMLLPDTAQAPAVDVRPIERLSQPTQPPTQPPAQPPAQPPLPRSEPSTQKPNFSTLDAVLQETGVPGNSQEILEVDLSDAGLSRSEDLLSDSAVSAFDQLAAEEPPMPGVREGGTVRDLRDRLIDSGNRIVIDLLAEDDTLNEPTPLLDEDSSEEPVLARKILEGTLDAQQPMKPLVEEVAPESQLLRPVQLSSYETPTSASDVSDFGTATASAPLDAVWEGFGSDGSMSSTERIAQLALDLTQASLESSAEATLLTRSGVMVGHSGRLPADDLEELRLKLEAETVSAPPGEEQAQSRIKFVHLSGSGKDYMLFTRRMDEADGLALTMVFEGNMPLSVIRRQSDRLVSALASLPEDAEESNTQPRTSANTSQRDVPAYDVPLDEAAVAEEAAAKAEQMPLMDSALMPAYGGPMMPYTYIWLLRDPRASLGEAMTQTLIAGLDSQLTRLGWAITTLRVHDDFVYLHADVPGERPAGEVVSELKRMSAQMLAQRYSGVDVDGLWAEAYLALYPGRDLSAEEVRDFLNFVRETA